MDGWKEEKKDERMDGWFIHLIGTAKDLLSHICGISISHCRATEGPKYKVCLFFVLFCFPEKLSVPQIPPKPILREAKQEFWAPYDG